MTTASPRIPDMNTRLQLLIVLGLLAGCNKPPTLARNGGYVLDYRLEANEQASPKLMAEALQQRLRGGGFPAATAAERGELVRIELPGSGPSDIKRVKKLLQSMGQMELLIGAERG